MKNNRREFIKKSLIGVSGAALVPGSYNSLTGFADAPTAPELPGRVLGKTGIKTPLISLGAAETTEPAFVKAAYGEGIKIFFSATYYGEGKNEKLVGDGLKNLPRDSFVVGTAAPPDGLDNRTGLFVRTFDPVAYIRKAEESLSRFGLDYVDIFLFPYAGKKGTVQHEGVLKAMTQLKKQGKTRFTGIASHSDTEEALRAAADSGIYDVAMISYNFKIKNKDSLDAAIAYAAKAGMGIVAMKTTAGVFRNKSGPALNSDAALKWVLQNENIASIVSGMSSLEQLQKNLAMIKNLKLTEKELMDLKQASVDSEPGLYCQQCKQCIPQCPYNLDIPGIMRSYMYAYGYKNTSQAWYTLEGANLPLKPCDSCEICKVKCLNRFDIKKRITDIARIKEIPKEFLTV
ncbi:MAG: aldo/keto reductase [Bacteroidales bacterium]|nr:aldo/keto reductase [Bacteroidales bacterium]